MNLRLIRNVLWGLVALAAVAGAFLLLRPAPSGTGEVAPMELGKPFVLTDQDGKSFDSRSLAGTPYVMFFGFTHCPDVCPNTLARLARLRGQLGDDGKALRILLVTVDPERDTPAELKKYVGLFDAPVTALTGSPQQIAEVTRSFGIYAKKAPGADGNYSVDHSSAVLLFDGDGRFGGTIAMEEGDPPALQKLRNITAA
ncbi:SCO family protein [Sphingomonas mesophila]|uniref:SCO family protein n=1 Tax=Sphingomonas mesophila TaxID=2303576 RepID=UPI000E571AC0|nr:SCO family protein [Sphingomonas mesophila]